MHGGGDYLYMHNEFQDQSYMQQHQIIKFFNPTPGWPSRPRANPMVKPFHLSNRMMTSRSVMPAISPPVNSFDAANRLNFRNEKVGRQHPRTKLLSVGPEAKDTFKRQKVNEGDVEDAAKAKTKVVQNLEINIENKTLGKDTFESMKDGFRT